MFITRLLACEIIDHRDVGLIIYDYYARLYSYTFHSMFITDIPRYTSSTFRMLDRKLDHIQFCGSYRKKLYPYIEEILYHCRRCFRQQDIFIAKDICIWSNASDNYVEQYTTITRVCICLGCYDKYALRNFT
jgi:hypothetical protein